jgi:hypothetical protein
MLFQGFKRIDLSVLFGIHQSGMNFKRIAVFFGIVILLALLFSLPPMRDELSWCWAESRDEASDYMRYLDEWPKGRHIAEAKARYEQRSWKDTTRAMINEALKKHAASKTDPDTIQEKKVRQERFFWKQASIENTIVSYQDYLQHYPAGEFSGQAHRRIDDLRNQGAGGGAGTNSTSQ